MRISDWSSDVCSSDLFTERAFVNGKLDLVQAEAVADLIAAGSAAAARAARRSLDGVFSRHCNALRSEERRVGKECVSTCRSRWSPDPYKKKTSLLECTSTVTYNEEFTKL